MCVLSTGFLLLLANMILYSLALTCFYQRLDLIILLLHFVYLLNDFLSFPLIYIFCHYLLLLILCSSFEKCYLFYILHFQYFPKYHHHLYTLFYTIYHPNLNYLVPFLIRIVFFYTFLLFLNLVLVHILV